MKKLTSVILAMSIASTFAAEYTQPYDRGGDYNIDRMRIPAVITLDNGSVLCAADFRHDHGSDSASNIDTLLAYSENGLDNWQYTMVNYFDDCKDGTNSTDSASFIDPELVQSKETGRIFLLTDIFPGGTGSPNSLYSTGYDKNGRLLLTSDGENYTAYIDEFDGDYAPIIDNGVKTEYTVDREYYLYKNGETIYTKQINSEEMIRQNVFYKGADYRLTPTSYLWMRYSDDNGKTWSNPVILNYGLKYDTERFFGTSPGSGLVIKYNGKERIIIPLYGYDGKEKSTVIYSDDNGETWQRGGSVEARPMLKKVSENRVVELPDGTLRMYCRNNYVLVAVSDSKDGGKTWSKAKADPELTCTQNCLVCFANYPNKINGKSVIIGSYPSKPDNRQDGVLRVGLVDEKGKTQWLAPYHINSGDFSYSSVAVLQNGNIALLWEDEAHHIKYTIYAIGENGEISEINGDNCTEEVDNSPSLIQNIWYHFVSFFGFA